jgi:hypothetical protein
MTVVAAAGIVWWVYATVLPAVVASSARPTAPALWCYALLIGFSLALAWANVWLAVGFVRSRRSGDDDEDGGGGGNRPVGPRPPPNQDPEWWPEFERQFSEYASRRPVRTG